MKRWLASTFFAATLISVANTAISATQKYTYSGPKYDTISSYVPAADCAFNGCPWDAFTGEMNIVFSFEYEGLLPIDEFIEINRSNALAANVQLSNGLVDEWRFVSARLITDVSGAIVDWSITGEIGPGSINSLFTRSTEVSDVAFWQWDLLNASNATIGEAVSRASTSGPGTWRVQPVPISASLPLVVIGIGAFASVSRKRRR